MWSLVFLGMTVVDIAYAEYTKKVGDRKTKTASTWAAALVVFNGLVVASFVGDKWLLIPVAAGAWVGTYISLKWIK